MKPRLAAFPKCFMDELCVHHTMSLLEWIEIAAGLGVDVRRISRSRIRGA